MFVSEGPLDKKWALVRVMARCRIGGKPLPEPKLTRVTDAYMRHQGEMNYLNHTLYNTNIGNKALFLR